MNHFPIADSLWEEEDMTLEVQWIHLNRSGGSSSMTAEHLCTWLQEATRDDTPYTKNLWKVVSLVKAYFCDVNFSE